VGPLGRRTPTDWEHVEKYPLSAIPKIAQPEGVPVVIGVSWYSNFDRPVLDNGRWWIGHGSLGTIRGGHCVCVKSRQPDLAAWWTFYDQGMEGACVGFGCSRMMTLLNRRRYEARWLWDRAKERDDWDDTNPGDDNGTSVRAALDVLVESGHVRWRATFSDDTATQRESHRAGTLDGVAVYRWAESAEDVLDVIAMPLARRLGAVPLLNSWGRDYPHIVWMPCEVLERLRADEGEIGIITDR
jgi:hypothetical protein